MPNALLNNMNGATAPGANMSPGTTPAGPGSPPAAPGGPGGPQKQVSLDQVKDGIMRQAQLDHRLRAMLESGKPIERKEAVNMCVGLVADRIFTAEEMAGYLTTLPDDPVQVREWVAKHAATVEGNLDQLLAMAHGQAAPPGVPQMPDMGGAQLVMPNG